MSKVMMTASVNPPVEKTSSYNPPCSHYPKCGGCQLQRFPYSEQLRLKQQYLCNRFRRQVPLHPAPEPFRYRARMDFITTFRKTGLHKKRSFRRIVDIEHCHLISIKANEILNKVKSLCRDYRIRDFDINRKEGFLKYVVIRETQSGESMVILITAEPVPDLEKDVKEMMDSILTSASVSSCWWLLSRESSDRTQTHKYYHVGKEGITETIGHYRFVIGPQMFFQNNVSVAQMCFDMIKKNVIGESVLDAYCGGGVIGLYISDAASSVLGIDMNKESIEKALANAALNEISNVEFMEADVEDFISGTERIFDTLVVDPPRAGLELQVIRALNKLCPRRIIYMSCNPNSQSKDIRKLTEYRLTDIHGFDMFPQTNHVETVAVLDRKT